MLQLENVLVRQGAFDLELDLRVEAGQSLALMGVSGSGKSTLLALIGGFLWPDRGRILWNSRDISRAPVAERPISVLFQDNNLFPHLSAAHNVALGLKPNLRLTPEDSGRVTKALAQVHLTEYANRRPAELSGGQQARVALARVLVQARPLLILDEPFAALDPGLRRDMLDLVQETSTREGRTLIMAVHDIRDAERICTDLVLLDAGRVRLQGKVSDLLRARPDPLAPWL